MRWHSTRNSYRIQEWSFLAIAETMGVSIATIGAAFYFHTLNHILIMSIFGWLLLLRTSISEERGIVMYEELADFLQDLEPSAPPSKSQDFHWQQGGIFPWSIAILWIVGPPIVKAIAIVQTLTDHFRNSLAAIPSNWARAVFCLDSSLGFELIPGFEDYLRANRQESEARNANNSYVEDIRDTSFSSISRQFQEEGSIALTIISAVSFIALVIATRFDNILAYMAALLAGFIFFLSFILSPAKLVLYAIPAIAYRCSLKSTAVTYWPLLFALHSSSVDDTLSYKLKTICNGRISQFKRFFSWFVLAIIVGKLIFWSWLVKFRDASPSDAIRFIVNDYLGPKLNGWQWASAMNALMAIITYWLADYWLRRMEEKLAVEPSVITRYLSYAGNISGVLSVYSIWANISILVHRTPFLRIPPFDKWWP